MQAQAHVRSILLVRLVSVSSKPALLVNSVRVPAKQAKLDPAGCRDDVFHPPGSEIRRADDKQ